MPTYTNASAALIQVGDITFSANEVKELYNYIDLSKDTTGYISLTSNVPYYNPINYVHTLISASVASVTLNDWKTTTGVEIWNTSANLITVFLQHTDNTPGLVVPGNSIRYIYGFNGAVKMLYFTYGGAVISGEAYVTELKRQDVTKLVSFA